jgi:cellulose synthase/poly-beta-1,6-N-acetylglucosamine synthase-like glycosyltransferase
MRAALTALAAVGAAPTGYLLALLLSATAAARRDPPRSAHRPRLVVVVPAHDEEGGIGATIASLEAAGATPIVVADNCADATAERAREAGATVWERHDDARRGKGHALAWAFERVLGELPDVEGVVVVDADCSVSPNLLEALAARLGAGARAVQCSYVVSNPEASTASAARYAGFALVNHVRPLGKSALGLSCGLLGTGMAFEVELLREVPWGAFDITEDTGYHLTLVAAGVRVQFAPEAWVASAMPTSFERGAAQRERWESGDVELARREAASLIAAGLRERDADRLVAGVDLLIPPQSLLMGMNASIGLVSLVAGTPRAVRLSLAALAGHAAFVVGGLAVARAPAAAYRALATAPMLAVRHAGLYARLVRGGREREWVRTARE